MNSTRSFGPTPLLVAATVVVIAAAMVATSGLSALTPSAASAATASGAAPSPAAINLAAAPRAPVSSLSGAPAGAVMTGSYSGDASVFVTFGLANESALNSLLAALIDPQSPQYHHYLSEAQFVADFSPAPAPYAEAVTYFDSFSGLHVLSYSDRIGMLVQGPASSVDSAFGVTLASYDTPGRGSYYAPTGTATLPAPIASAVVQLEGLSSYLDGQTMLSGATSLGKAPSTVATENGYPAPVDCGFGVQCLWGSDLQVAYDEQSLLNVTLATGESIATILWAGCTVATTGTCPTGDLTGSYDPNDVYTYYNDTVVPTGQTPATVVGVPFDGAPGPGVSASYDVSGAVLENTLDLDMVGSTAPGSTIYNVYGLSSLDSETDAAMAYILSDLPNVNVITNSWGAQDHVDSAWSEYMQTAASRGVTVLASTGDAGSSDLSSRWVGSAAEFPASVGYETYGVLGVGGTTITLNDDPLAPVTSYLHITSQIAWYDPDYDGSPVGSSGGVSTNYPEPIWQVNSEANDVILSAGQGAHRGLPDVSAIGNNTIIYQTVDGAAIPSEEEVWGTSIASPLTAGMLGEVDAILARYSAPSLGFVNPTVYSLANEMVQPYVNTTTTGFVSTGDYHGLLPTVPFYDVTEGQNFQYNALPGYDLVTGWGSLDAYNFTTYVFSYNYSGSNFSVSGVRSVLSLTGLNVTSSGVSYNASVQQNFFVANALGAPLYWVQNVIYIANNSPGIWTVDYTGWVVFPFYGLYPSLTVYEYNYPVTEYNISTPITWTIQSWLGMNASVPVVNFEIDSQMLQLPVPGASFIIGGYNYQYYWQGQEYSNGPYPDTIAPGGLAPQFGLVGGPSGGDGEFTSGTGGSLSTSFEMTGNSTYDPVNFGATFSGTVDQTGETASNLVWSGAGASWSVTTSPSGQDQGVVSYSVANAGNPATFPLGHYAVNFTESGLPAGTAWSVTFNGAQQSCMAGSTGGPCGPSWMVFLSTNGTGLAFFASANGYAATPPSGTVTVHGQNVTQPLTFAPAPYTITFTESGLPGNVRWSVTITGRGSESNASGDPIVFEGFVNGAYPFTVGSVSGYNATPSSGSVPVNGADASQSISFSSGGGGGGGGLPPFTLFGLSGLTLIFTLLAVIIVCVAVAAVAAVLARRKPPAAVAPSTMAAPPAGWTPPSAPPGAYPGGAPGWPPPPPSAPTEGGYPAAAPPAAPPYPVTPPPSVPYQAPPPAPVEPTPPSGGGTPAEPPSPPAEPMPSPAPPAPTPPQFCTGCGSPLGPTSRFCPNCGRSLG